MNVHKLIFTKLPVIISRFTLHTVKLILIGNVFFVFFFFCFFYFLGISCCISFTLAQICVHSLGLICIFIINISIFVPNKLLFCVPSKDTDFQYTCIVAQRFIHEIRFNYTSLLSIFILFSRNKLLILRQKCNMRFKEVCILQKLQYVRTINLILKRSPKLINFKKKHCLYFFLQDILDL